jgi:hypothetical protein
MTQLFDARTGYLGYQLVVDETNVYFVSGSEVLSVPKAGGPSTKIGYGAQFKSYIKDMMQDTKNLFLVTTHGSAARKEDEILMLPKTPITVAAQ